MKNHLRQFLVYCLLAMTFVISLIIQPGVGQGAAQPDSPIPAPDPIVAEYAHTFGISNEEAQRRLQLQAVMDSLEEQVGKGEPTYAGSWTQHQPDFRLVVAFASPDGKTLIQKYLAGIDWADLVEVQQAKFTVGELNEIFEKVREAAGATKIPFASGANYQTGKVNIYTPDPETLRSQLETQDPIKQYIDDITFVYQESMAVPAALTYPYLLGGHAISDCTTGLTVTRNSDSRRFMATAGHCSNSNNVVYNGVSSIYLGPVVFENDPLGNVGAYGDDIDFQAHDASVRSFDLTNVIRNGATSTASIISTKAKANTLNDYVCKYGKVTGQTCGTVTDINYSPGGIYGTSNHYVKVNKAVGAIGDMACPGDSGSPVYKYETGGLWALGILSGKDPDLCTGDAVDWFIYTPVDEIIRTEFNILTTHYQQRYHLNVWVGTNCTEYRTPVDDNGNLISGQQTSQACGTSLPAGSSGTVQSYNAYVVGQSWREGMWRGGVGYARAVPLNSNGTINWGAAPAWTACCAGGTAPLAQEGKIVGNHYYLNVFLPGGSCTEYKTPLHNNGDLNWTLQTSQPCRTSLPGSGTVQSYNSYVVGGYWREGVWRNNAGYIRSVPLNSTNTDINYGGAPGWTSCCAGATVPAAQGGDILTYP